jgi:hypothetical protein
MHDPVVKWLSDAPPAGRVVVTLRSQGMLLPVQQLRQGDRLDIVATAVPGEERPRVVGRDAYYIGAMMAKSQPQRRSALTDMVASASRKPSPAGVAGLVLAVRPQDVVPIARAEAERNRLSFALHGKNEIESGKLLDIAPPAAVRRAPAPQPKEIEVISGRRRERMPIQ